MKPSSSGETSAVIRTLTRPSASRSTDGRNFGAPLIVLPAANWAACSNWVCIFFWAGVRDSRSRRKASIYSRVFSLRCPLATCAWTPGPATIHTTASAKQTAFAARRATKGKRVEDFGGRFIVFEVSDGSFLRPQPESPSKNKRNWSGKKGHARAKNFRCPQTRVGPSRGRAASKNLRRKPIMAAAAQTDRSDLRREPRVKSCRQQQAA